MSKLKKQTINISRIDRLIDDLKQKGKRYKIIILAQLKGRGLNDILPVTEQYRIYKLRKIYYEDKVMVEQVIAVDHMDLDDFIISKCFPRSNDPSVAEWPLILRNIHD